MSDYKFIKIIYYNYPKVWLACDFWGKCNFEKLKTLFIPEMTYVGIHNRRTDHLEFIKKTADMVPIEIDYFYDAMDYFRFYSLSFKYGV